MFEQIFKDFGLSSPKLVPISVIVSFNNNLFQNISALGLDKLEIEERKGEDLICEEESFKLKKSFYAQGIPVLDEEWKDPPISILVPHIRS
jgi:hypothetical protein